MNSPQLDSETVASGEADVSGEICDQECEGNGPYRRDRFRTINRPFLDAAEILIRGYRTHLNDLPYYRAPYPDRRRKGALARTAAQFTDERQANGLQAPRIGEKVENMAIKPTRPLQVRDLLAIHRTPPTPRVG